MTTIDTAELRARFVQMLTVDGSLDRRRSDFNQAIFHPKDGSFGGGWAIWTRTDLDMVMTAFDRAVKSIERERRR